MVIKYLILFFFRVSTTITFVIDKMRFPYTILTHELFIIASNMHRVKKHAIGTLLRNVCFHCVMLIILCQKIFLPISLPKQCLLCPCLRTPRQSPSMANLQCQALYTSPCHKAGHDSMLNISFLFRLSSCHHQGILYVCI